MTNDARPTLAPTTYDTPEAALAAALDPNGVGEWDRDLDGVLQRLARYGWALVPSDDEDREFRVVARLAAQMEALRWAVNRAEQRELEALAELDEAKAEIARLRASLAYHHGGTHGLACTVCEPPPSRRAALATSKS
jgi:hypothetical protein